MNTKDILYHLRTERGLSQDELAAKIFVTRQAVSRWENGEAVPNTETVKPRRMSKRSSCFPRSLTCRSIRFLALRGS